ncbi:MAG: ferrochelatase [Breznakibacter sp.]
MFDHSEKATILLINVGTPDSPSVPDVRRYLGQFLNDPRVIDLPWLARKILVNCIIVPFRAPKSAALYRRLWTDRGSPLLFHTRAFAKRLQSRLGDGFHVEVGMRYGNPTIAEAIDKILKGGYRRVVVAPMFPHYASSTTGTAVAAVMDEFAKRDVVPDIRFLGQFFEHPTYLGAFADRIRQAGYREYDHVLFSYHGLPKRHVERTHRAQTCAQLGCVSHYGADNRFCYHAACHRTTELLAGILDLPQGTYTTAFQSRLGKGWLEPFSDDAVKRLAKQGTRRLLVVSPAFVADCLETVVEIGYEYDGLFRNNGGEKLSLVESLNDFPQWVDGFAGILGEPLSLT